MERELVPLAPPPPPPRLQPTLDLGIPGVVPCQVPHHVTRDKRSDFI